MAPAPPPPPPPPPPLCLPFRSKKPRRVTTLAASEKGSHSHHSQTSFPDSRISSTNNLRSSSSTLTLDQDLITEDSENYNVSLPGSQHEPPKKWRHVWGTSKAGGAKGERTPATTMSRKDSSGSSSSTDSRAANTPSRGHSDQQPSLSRNSSSRSNGLRSAPRPGIHGNDSSSTLIGSALERKINDVESVREKVDTGSRLIDLRALMAKDNLDY